MNSASEFLNTWLKEDLIKDSKLSSTFNGYYSSYKRHFTDRIKYYYDRQLKEIEELIASREEPKVLKIGCRTGTESIWMALQGANVSAV